MTHTGNRMEKAWDALRYDTHHSYIWEYAADLVELLAPAFGERILDLGCGTGHLAARIAGAGAEVVGVDNDPRMVAQARQNYPALRFEVADGASFRFDDPFDAVFSNAALHWMTEPDRVADSIARALKPGGRFVAELGGKGNIQGILEAMEEALGAAGTGLAGRGNPWYFPSLGEYASLLERHGLVVEYARLFDRPTRLEGGEDGMRNWLGMFANHLLAAVPEASRPVIIQDLESRLRPRMYHEGVWIADYRRLRVVAWKKS